MQQTNEEICKQLLAKLPHDFYGSIELNFHKGILMWAKTVITTKFNPERATAENNNDYHRK